MMKQFSLEGFMPALKWLERQVLLFPITVVVLACASFLAGGCCAAWQWWLAVGLMLSLPWAKERPRVALIADGLFLGVLLALLLIAPMTYDNGNLVDYLSYHQPMARFLVEGWNPVRDPLAHGIVDNLGLDIRGMSYLHVTFISKTTAIFAACAYFFIRDPYSVMFPLEVFLLLSVVFAIVRLWRSRFLVCGVLAFVLLTRTIWWSWAVDASVALASVGLLLTMLHSLRVKRLNFIALTAFTFWMMNIKLPAAFAAFVFWCLFALRFLWLDHLNLKKNLRFFSSLGVLLTLLFAIVSFNPYGTSLRDYGHPLYPFKTTDESRFPSRDLTWDFTVCNEDIKTMSYFGEFFNAYVSPRLARAYYNWRLNRDDFRPHRYTWDYSVTEIRRVSPLATGKRITMLAGLSLLLILPGARLLGLMMACSFFLFPREYMGYLRYQPWLEMLPVLAAALLCEYVVNRFPKIRQYMTVVMGVVFLLTAVNWARGATYSLRIKDATIALRSSAIYPARPFKSKLNDPRSLYRDCRQHHNAAALLMRQAGRSDVEVTSLAAGEVEGYWQTIFGYFLPDAVRLPVRLPDIPGGALRRCLYAWTVIYPRALFRL